MARSSELTRQRRNLTKAWLKWRLWIAALVVLAIAAVGGKIALDSIGEGARADLQAGAQSNATGIAQAMSKQVDSTLATLRQGYDPAVLGGIIERGDRAAAQAAADDLASRSDAVLRAWLLPVGHAQSDLSVVPPLAFATLDLLRRAETSGKASPPEVLLLGQEGQHVAVVFPVLGPEQKVLGHLVMALDVALVQQAAGGAPATTGYDEVVQAVDGAKPLVLVQRGDPAYRRGPATAVAPVRGTSWRVSYWSPRVAAPASGGGEEASVLPLLMGGGAVVLVGAGLFVALRRRRGGVAPPAPAAEDNVGAPLAEKLAALKLGVMPAPPGPADAGAVIVEEGMPAPDPAHGAQSAEPPPPPAAAAGAEPRSPDEIPESIFRAYDVRGVVGKTLTAEVVYEIGRALGSEAYDRGQQTLTMACDGRSSGPELMQALSEGLRATGRDVIDVGRVPTPVLYYSTHFLETGSGVMVTGSHNPPEYNGLKIMLGGETLFGDDIAALRTRILAGEFVQGQGNTRSMEIIDEYVRRISEEIPVALSGSMKVVVDCGNGIAGAVAPKLIRALGHDVVELFCEVDGSFPNHHPDPSQPENLQDLIATVKSEGADIGFAFDGDGDRLGVVDGAGEILWPDRQMMLFAADVLAANPGAEIVFDVKCSSLLSKVITANGGVPVMWKTGHSFMKNKLRESGAPLAGEMSGHIFFNDRWYGFDDALYSAARMLEILVALEAKPADVFAKLPNGVSTPELRLDMNEGEHHEFMKKLMQTEQLADGNVTTIDGLRVDFDDSWGLVRASNTTPCLVLRFEGDDAQALARVQDHFRAVLMDLDPSLTLPF